MWAGAHASGWAAGGSLLRRGARSPALEAASRLARLLLGPLGRVAVRPVRRPRGRRLRHARHALLRRMAARA
eukprot:13659557-Alexandrium_andersonii.AAC.1